LLPVVVVRLKSRQLAPALPKVKEIQSVQKATIVSLLVSQAGPLTMGCALIVDATYKKISY
jgi:hypothetical protein